MEDIRYPIGKYEPVPFDERLCHQRIINIEFLPQDLERSLLNLDEEQLRVPYREGGWSICQIAHHLADSHMNAYIRFKLALTEDKPVIKPYDQDAWAGLPDNDSIPVNVSVTLLFALHRKWAGLIKSIKPEDWSRSVIHPEYKKEMDLWYLLGLYDWHGRHHVAQINSFREKMNW